MELTQGPVTRRNGKIRMSFEIEFDEACRPGDLLEAESELQLLLNSTGFGAAVIPCADERPQELRRFRESGHVSRAPSHREYL